MEILLFEKKYSEFARAWWWVLQVGIFEIYSEKSKSGTFVSNFNIAMHCGDFEFLWYQLYQFSTLWGQSVDFHHVPSEQSTSVVCPLLVFEFAEEFDILLIFLFKKPN